MMQMPKLLTRVGNRTITLIFCIIAMLSLATIAVSQTGFVVITAFIISFIMFNLLVANLDIFIENFSNNKDTGRIRGLYLSITSASWVLAQIISGSIINKSSFAGIYTLSAMFTILVFLIFYFFLTDFKDPEYKKVPVFRTIKNFIKSKHLSKIFIINLILKFFYTWMVIYTPIYLHEYMLFPWDKIGIIFSIMLLPFVLLDYPLGKLSDKIGEKKMLLIGFIVITLSTLAIPFVKTNTFLVWSLVLLLTRVGAATIETMSESYFFKYIDPENADAISFFRNTTPLSFILGPALAIPILLYVPSFEYIFFVLGAILMIGFWITLRLRDVK